MRQESASGRGKIDEAGQPRGFRYPQAYYPSGSYGGPPSLDGRQQLQQNLAFFLRAANSASPLEVSFQDEYGYYQFYACPTNYAYVIDLGVSAGFDRQRPVVANGIIRLKDLVSQDGDIWSSLGKQVTGKR